MFADDGVFVRDAKAVCIQRLVKTGTRRRRRRTGPPSSGRFVVASDGAGAPRLEAP